MTVRRVGHPDPETVAEVLALARAAAGTDGVYPLAEEAVLRLRHGGDPPPVHLLACAGAGGRLHGYAQLALKDAAEGATAELVVHPEARRRGTGRALVTAAIQAAGREDPAARLRLWAHGDHPGAAALAASLGFARTRVLYQLRRPLTAPVAEPVLPDGVTLRAFRPGGDDEKWLALNARAFADHPEQGRWSARELRLRMAEPWFDPAGFLLAERAGRLVGFHWTKIHPGDQREGPIGEVYVLGVDPTEHGSGLGTALTLAGLRHLRERGMDRVMLYVDESNRTAVSLYTGLGFTRWSVDVTYTRGG
jgi:mycothiol synthase